MKKEQLLRESLMNKWKFFLLQCMKMVDLNNLLFFLLSVTVPYILKQSKLNDPEVIVRKNLAPEDLHGQKKNNLPYNY